MKAGSAGAVSSAFTLMELMISGALMALILTAAYLCLNAGFSTRKLVEPRIDAVQTARVVLSLLAADLRAACSLDKDSDFLGMDRTVDGMEADNVDFATHNYTPRRPGEGDYCQVSYYLDRDAATGDWILWRRRNPALALDALSGGKREEIARGVRGLKLEYYDGWDWYDTWGDVEGRGREQTSFREQYNLTGLPEAVRVTLWLEPKAEGSPASRGTVSTGATTNSEPPLVFQTVSRLNLAARVAAAANAGGGTESSPASPAGQNSTPANPGPGP